MPTNRWTAESEEEERRGGRGTETDGRPYTALRRQ